MKDIKIKYLLTIGSFWNDIGFPEYVVDLKKDAFADIKSRGFKKTKYDYYENTPLCQWAKIEKIKYIPNNKA